MLHQKGTERLRAYPTHQAVQTMGSTALITHEKLIAYGGYNVKNILESLNVIEYKAHKCRFTQFTIGIR
jgi:hypothetical protein